MEEEDEGGRGLRFYSIPTPLNQSWLDHEIPIDIQGFTIRLTLKVLGVYLLSFLGFMAFLKLGMFENADTKWWVILGFVWFLITLYFGSLQQNKELRATLIRSVVNYFFPWGNRKIMTRRTSKAVGFYGLTNIKDVYENGMIEFIDGTVGRMYFVVGSASRLLFDDDRRAILSRVDSFWRKMDLDSEFIFFTVKEAQKVHNQINALIKRKENLDVDCPGIRELFDEQYYILHDVIGSQFTSIHQYMILKAKSAEAFRRSEAMLRNEVESSSLMFKQCTIMNGKNTLAVLKSIYQ